LFKKVIVSYKEKMLIKVLLAFACCGMATVQANLPCLGAPSNVPYNFAASPESCGAYIICMNNEAFHGHGCPDEFLFEPITQSCILDASCIECSPFGVQNLPHPDGCDQYIQCIMGTREFRTCPPGFLFDRTIGIANCNQEHLVTCPGNPNTTVPTQPTETTVTTEPTVPTETTQPLPTTTTSQPPTETFPTTTTSQPPPQLPVCVPGGQVHHAHPTDCTRFFLCICLQLECVLWEQQCINNFYWNQRITQCDFPENAGCVSRPTDPPSTTTIIPDPPSTTTIIPDPPSTTTIIPDPPSTTTSTPPLFPPTPSPTPGSEIEPESHSLKDIHRFVVYLDGRKEEVTDNY